MMHHCQSHLSDLDLAAAAIRRRGRLLSLADLCYLACAWAGLMRLGAMVVAVMLRASRSR
jgi:hypothetical protein